MGHTTNHRLRLEAEHQAFLQAYKGRLGYLASSDIIATPEAMLHYLKSLRRHVQSWVNDIDDQIALHHKREERRRQAEKG